MQNVGAQGLRWFNPGDSSSGTFQLDGKLPVLRTGDIGLVQPPGLSLSS